MLDHWLTLGGLLPAYVTVLITLAATAWIFLRDQSANGYFGRLFASTIVSAVLLAGAVVILTEEVSPFLVIGVGFTALTVAPICVLVGLAATFWRRQRNASAMLPKEGSVG